MSTLDKYSSYKDSGVAWLGEIPKNWKILSTKRFHKNIKELNSRNKCDNILSLTLRGVVNNNLDNPEGLVPKDYATYQIFEKNDLVFKLIDLENISTSRVGLVHEKGIMSSAYIRLNTGKSSLPKYAYYYYYNLYLTQVYNNLGSGVRSTLGPIDLLNITYIEPSMTEQIKIANFLDIKTTQIDEAIKQKDELIGLLKERRKILIHKVVTQGLDSIVKMKDSGVEWLGAVPEHWEIVKNRVLFSERNEAGNENLPILMVSIHTAVSSEEIDDEKNIRGKIRIQDKTSYKLVKPTDIVFNMMRAWQGAIGTVRVKGMVSPAYVVGKSSSEIDTEYFEYQYRTESFIQQMDRFSKGITDFRKRLYWSEFKQLNTILPPLSEQHDIVEYIKRNNDKIDTAIGLQQKEIEKLKEYKATLIDSLVTGKKRV